VRVKDAVLAALRRRADRVEDLHALLDAYDTAQHEALEDPRTTGPRDLEYLVGAGAYPHLRWRRAVREIRRAEQATLARVDRALVKMRLAIEATRVAEARDPGTLWVKPLDLEEARLRLATRKHAA
jgi:hypothetical protein